MRKLQDSHKIAILFFAAFVFRIIAFFISDNVLDITDYETHSRLFETRRWISDGWFYPSTYFSPAYYFIIRLCWFFYSSDIALLPRIVNIFFGAGIILLYIPFMRLFFSRLVVFSSAVLLCFMPLPVLSSVVTIASIPYSFFALLFFYIFMLYLQKRSFTFFILSIILANITVAFRFEAILLLPPFSFLLIQKRKLKECFVFSCFALFTFFLHLFLCYLASRDFLLPLRVQNFNAYGSVLKICPTVPMRLWSFFNAYLEVFSPVGVFAVLLGFVLMIKGKKGSLLLSLFSISFFVLLIKTIDGTFEAYFLRYYVLWAILLLPFMLYPFEFFLEKFNFSKKYIYVFVLLMSVFYITQVFKNAAVQKPKNEYKEVSRWMRNNLADSDIVLLDRVHRQFMIVESNLADGQILDPVCLPDSASVVDVDATLKLLTQKLPLKILVYKRDGGGYLEVNFITLLENSRHYDAKILFENDLWAIWSVSKSS